MNLDPPHSIHGLPTRIASSGSIQSRDAKHDRKHEMSPDPNDNDELELSEEAENVPKHQPGTNHAGDLDTAGDDGNLDVTV